MVISTLSPGMHISVPSGRVANTCYVSCTEVELRTIVVEERSMTATLVFCQNVNLSGKFGMAVNGARFSQNLSSFDLCSLNTTKQSTDVITSLSLIEEFTEHLDTSYNSFLGLFFQTCDFNFLIQMKNTSAQHGQ